MLGAAGALLCMALGTALGAGLKERRCARLRLLENEVELLARLRVLTRSKGSGRTNTYTLADLTVDTAARTARRGDAPLNLSAREYALLEYLIRNQGVVLSRAQIENSLWSYDYAGGTNVVDVYISYLRKKLDGDDRPKLLHTVRGMGWVLKEDKP